MTAAGPLPDILEINTDLFANVLDGVTDDHARRRLHGTNSIAFLAAHLVDARCMMAGLLGSPLANPIGDALKDVRSADDVVELPALDGLRAEWRRIAPHVEMQARTATAERLGTTSPQRFPVADPSIGGGLAFLLQHESYHLGQMALLRRQLGYPAMSYERRSGAR